MAIPRYDEIMRYALDLLNDGSARRPKGLEAELARQFELTEEELGQMYDSGNGPVFLDRISWALSYLKMAGFVTRPKRGHYKINAEGLELLSNPEKVKAVVKIKLRIRDKRKKLAELGDFGELAEPNEADAEGAEGAVEVVDEDSNQTPQDRLEEAYKNIRQSAYEAMLDTIMSKTPRAFEHLVVKLLEQMGYGGEVGAPGEVTPASNDGGIDGVIKEDVLGLGRIHIQAKRYDRDNTVGRSEIQKFVGALAVAQSNKGVFITTSRYSSGALKYAESLHGSTTLVLIDGQKLAKYMYDYNLGVQKEQTIEIKKIDGDFWDAMQDDPTDEGQNG